MLLYYVKCLCFGVYVLLCVCTVCAYVWQCESVCVRVFVSTCSCVYVCVLLYVGVVNMFGSTAPPFVL